MKINATMQIMLMALKLGNVFFMQNMIQPDKLLMHFKPLCCPILKWCHPKNSRKQSYRWFWRTGKNKTCAIVVSVSVFGSVHYHAQPLSRVFITSFTSSQSDEYQLGFGFSSVRKKHTLCLSTEPQTPNKYFHQSRDTPSFLVADNDTIFTSICVRTMVICEAILYASLAETVGARSRCQVWL